MNQPDPSESPKAHNTSIERLSPILIEVQVEVPWSKVNEGLEHAYRLVQRETRMRGFRPGKVPRAVVKQLMGPRIEDDVRQRLIEDGIAHAVREHALRAIAVTKIDASPIKSGAALAFKALVEVPPDIEKIDVSQLAVERVTPVVEAGAIDKELEKLRERNAELTPPDEARPAQDGDVVTLEINVKVGGVDRPDLASTESRAELGQGELLEAIEEAVRGMSVGQSRTAAHTFGQDADPGLRGETAEFQIGLRQIQQKVLPEVDDEFAKDLDHESLAELRSSIEQRLLAAAEETSNARLRDALIDSLLATNPIPIPSSLVRQEEQALLENFKRFFQLGAQPGFDPEALRPVMRAQAERKAHASLLLQELTRRENLEVKDEDIDARLQAIAAETGKHIAKVKAEHQGRQREDLRARLLQDKVLEYLERQATITEVSAEEHARREAERMAKGSQGEQEAGEGAEASKQAPAASAEPDPAAIADAKAQSDDPAPSETTKAKAPRKSKKKPEAAEADES